MGLSSFFKKRKKEDKKKEEVDCHININMDGCDACGKCSIACPNNVLIIPETVVTVRDSQVCRSCRLCMAVCPNNCITIN